MHQIVKKKLIKLISKVCFQSHHVPDIVKHEREIVQSPVLFRVLAIHQLVIIASSHLVRTELTSSIIPWRSAVLLFGARGQKSSTSEVRSAAQWRGRKRLLQHTDHAFFCCLEVYNPSSILIYKISCISCWWHLFNS